MIINDISQNIIKYKEKINRAYNSIIKNENYNNLLRYGISFGTNYLLLLQLLKKYSNYKMNETIISSIELMLKLMINEENYENDNEVYRITKYKELIEILYSSVLYVDENCLLKKGVNYINNYARTNYEKINNLNKFFENDILVNIVSYENIKKTSNDVFILSMLVYYDKILLIEPKNYTFESIIYTGEAILYSFYCLVAKNILKPIDIENISFINKVRTKLPKEVQESLKLITTIRNGYVHFNKSVTDEDFLCVINNYNLLMQWVFNEYSLILDVKYIFDRSPFEENCTCEKNIKQFSLKELTDLIKSTNNQQLNSIKAEISKNYDSIKKQNEEINRQYLEIQKENELLRKENENLKKEFLEYSKTILENIAINTEYLKKTFNLAKGVDDKVDSLLSLFKDLNNDIKIQKEQLSSTISILNDKNKIEKDISKFQTKTVEKIDNEIKEKKISFDYNYYKNQMQSLLGKECFNKLTDNSKSFLVTAKIMFNELNKIDNENIDYSGVCLLLTKSLENECKKRFYYRFIDYMEDENKYIDDFPYAYLIKIKDELYLKKDDEFTLGVIPHALNVAYSNGAKSKLNNVMLEYCKNVLFINKNEDFIVKTLRTIGLGVEKATNDFRNPAAHVEPLNRITAIECFNLLKEVEKILQIIVLNTR